MRFLPTFSLLFLASLGVAQAQCVGGLVGNCPVAVSPQPSDLLLGWQSGQTPHTRAFSLNTVAAAGLSGANLSASNVTDSGTSTTMTLGAWMSYFTGTSNPNPIVQGGAANFTGAFKIGGVTQAFPVSGLLVGTVDAQTLTNKIISGASNTLSNVSLGSLASAAANTVVGNGTGASATPTALAVPSCSGLNGALSWTSGTGFGCNTIHGLIGVKTFCASGCGATGGTYTPDAGTSRVIVEVQAPGGGSGGCAATSASTSCVSGAASSGSYARALATASFSGVTVTIGATGTGGTAGANNGVAGGTTSFGSQISCPGGVAGGGGPAFTTTAWVVAFSGSGNTTGCTETGPTTLANIAGQGGAAGFASGFADSSQFSGAGGEAVLGHGGPGVIGAAAGSFGSGVGTGYGAGAAGWASAASQAAHVGVAGQPGIVIVYEFN